MRILVVSDTHRDYYTLNQVIKSQPSAEVVFHLGDGADDIERIKSLYDNKMIISLRGNCDWNCSKSYIEQITLESKKIFATHGHLFGVKISLTDIITEAKKNDANILLFGHTHQALCDYVDDMHIMNPGSLHGYNATYGIIDITPNGNIVTNLIKYQDTI